MGSALWAGISGLNASSKELDVIANNLANVNTVGFKSGTTYFADVLSQSISGGSGGTMQVGRGVAVTEVQTQFGAGSFESTGNATDAAIDGDGFFMVNDDEGATYYTRAGAFHLNSDYLLVDINDYTVQGQTIVNGQAGPLGDINLQGVQSEPAATTTVSLGANLNSATETGGQYNTTQTVYDSLGANHTLNTVFTRTENAAGGGYWGIEASLGAEPGILNYDGVIFDSDGNMTGMYTGEATATGGGTVTADRAGMIYKDTTSTFTLARTAGGIWSITDNGGYANASLVNSSAASPQISLDGTGTVDLTIAPTAPAGATTVTFTLNNTVTMGLSDIDIDLTGITLPGGATIGNGNHITWNLIGDDSLDITQYASASVIRSVTADGYASGQLKTLSIDADGVISGFFTNGQTSQLAQIVLAKFTNPWGLNKLGSNLFGQTVVSGAAIQNNPGSSGMGALTPNTLEMSNTDIATEFIKMITAQKAYQSSARVVTTQDTIMQELMNLKRS
ncbi:MAG: flagellar hook protein FlgE [Deltaproteobacteria bacterium]